MLAGTRVTIVNSYIHKSLNKPNNRLAIYEEHVDHLGVVHCHRYYCPADHNTAQALADWAAGFDVRIAESEGLRLVEFIQEGGDPVEATSDYLTAQQRAKAIVRGMMRAENPETVLPTVEYINTSITDTQLTNFFSAAKATRIRARVDNILANKLFLESDVSEEL